MPLIVGRSFSFGSRAIFDQTKLKLRPTLLERPASQRLLLVGGFALPTVHDLPVKDRVLDTRF